MSTKDTEREPLPPALSAEEWNGATTDKQFSESAVRIIALCNAALPDSDPRKITRDALDNLRRQVDCGDPDNAPMISHATTYRAERAANDAARAFIAALESLLPPDR